MNIIFFFICADVMEETEEKVEKAENVEKAAEDAIFNI